MTMKVRTVTRDRSLASGVAMKVVDVDLPAGTFFGEEALISAGSKKNTYVTAVHVSYLYMLSSKDFQGVLEEYPECKDILEVGVDNS